MKKILPFLFAFTAALAPIEGDAQTSPLEVSRTEHQPILLAQVAGICIKDSGYAESCNCPHHPEIRRMCYRQKDSNTGRPCATVCDTCQQCPPG